MSGVVGQPSAWMMHAMRVERRLSGSVTMRTMRGIVTAVLLAGSTSLTAQTPQNPSDQLHVSGCVAMGEQGKYVLQNATYIGIATRTKAMPQATADSPQSPTRSYELSGSSDFKTYLGHKVEVAGALERSQDDKPVSTSAGSPALQVLKVTSLKSVGSKCP
jgi:hypothetical protein